MKKISKPDSLQLDRALAKALEALDADLVSAVLATGIELKGKGVLVRAARDIKARTPPDVLHLLLEVGADPNEWTQGQTTTTALCCALINKNIKWVQTLLEAGADPNDPRPAVGALACAFNANSTALVHLLKKHGADPLRCGNPGWWKEQKADLRAWYEQAKAEAAARELSRGMRRPAAAGRKRF